MTKSDIYETVTNAIIEAIEAGQTADKFTMPWSGFNASPVNANTGKHYRGVNVFTLWAIQMHHGYRSGQWATYKQWQELGAQVQKGAKAARIVFWKAVKVEAQDDNEEEETRLFAKWSMVFNADQVDGYELPAEGTNTKRSIEDMHEVDMFVEHMNADIRVGSDSAYYHRSQDYVAMPLKELFTGTDTSTATECYYSTMFHELTHWTGANHRLDRTKGNKFGDKDYAYEELIAELGAAMMCASLGITTHTRPDHAQYIDSWLKALKNDKKYIFSAASQAQKAVDFMFSLQPECEET